MTNKELRWIGRLWRPFRGFAVLILSLTVVSTFVIISLPLVLKRAFDGLQGGLTERSLMMAVLLYLTLGTLEWALATGLIFLRGSMNLRFEVAARGQAYAHLVHHSAGFFQRFRTGDLVTRLTDDVSEKLSWFICSGIFRAFSAACVVVFSVVMMVRLDPLLTLFTVGPLPILILLFIRMGTVLDERFEQVQERISDLNGALEATFSGIRVVKAYGRESAEERSFARFAEACARAEVDAAKSRTLVDSLFGHVWQLGVVVVLLAGGVSVMNGRLTIGTFIAFDAYVLLLIFPMFDIGTLFVRGRQSSVSIGRLLELEETRPEIVEAPLAAEAPALLDGRLRFESVSYAYQCTEAGVSHAADAAARGVTLHAKGATADARGPTADARGHTADAKGPTADAKGVVAQETTIFQKEVPRIVDGHGRIHTTGSHLEAAEDLCENLFRTQDEETLEIGTGDGHSRQGPDSDARESDIVPHPPAGSPQRWESGSRRLVLREISFDLSPGQIVAVVGTVGAGKTTLMRLVPRLVDPSEGRVLIDGIDLRDLPLSGLRSMIGYVPQEAVLFSGTIRDNIRFGRSEVSDERILQACHVSRLSRDFSMFAEGLDTRVGVRGMTLSGGQKQRVALARALAGDPRILVLDDVTAALDAETEASLWEELHRVLPGLATLVVTHRTATLERADRILVLDAGALVEQGTHLDLSGRGEIYRSIYRRHVLEERLGTGDPESQERDPDAVASPESPAGPGGSSSGFTNDTPSM